jgi:copper chaperone CopZ
VVKKALEGLTGVRRAEVSLATKQAVVTYDAEQVTVAQMLAAIQQAGFAARRHQ